MRTLLLCCLVVQTLFASEVRKTICLNMIVKNEVSVIERCLDSVKPIIDYWVIVDTGSTDGTPEAIRRCMKEIPGELHERPWVNFELNRNEALAWAKGKGDYVLFIDADERLVFSEDFSIPQLTLDSYNAIVKQSDQLEYHRTLLVKNLLDWSWQGVLHEVVFCPEAKTEGVLQGVINISTTEEGARYKDPQKYHKDAAVLEEALKKDPDSSRYVFFLAQSYANAGEYSLALKNYEKRALMPGWDQEIFWSLYNIARLQELLKMPSDTVIASYSKAYQFRPSRAEPLFCLAKFYLRQNNISMAYLISKFALTIPPSQDSMFVEKQVIEIALPMQYMDTSYLMGRYKETVAAIEKLIAHPSCPLEQKAQLEKNRDSLLQYLKGLQRS